jgi:AraC-like DNA-binding protein
MTGESLQEYLTLYKLRLVEDKLNFSPASISQIVDELGFSDESHLSRQFKKYSGYSPVQYRNKKRHGSESLL